MTDSPSPQRQQPNPAVVQLLAIRQDVSSLRRELSDRQEVQPQVPQGSAILKVALWAAASMTFFITFFAGWEMMQIQSESGNSIAEVYYRLSGRVFVGLSIFLTVGLMYWSYWVHPIGFSTSSKRVK